MLLDWLDQSLAANPRARYFLQDGSQIPIEILSITSAIINAAGYNTVLLTETASLALNYFT